MADQKISALTTITGANTAAGDLIPIVDVSDTTQCASGTTKSITRAQATIAVGTQTLVSTYANNAAAVAGGLTAGAFYRTGADPDVVCVVH